MTVRISGLKAVGVRDGEKITLPSWELMVAAGSQNEST